MVYVAFSDASKEKILFVFACQQADAAYSFLGKVKEDDPRLISFYSGLIESKEISWKNQLLVTLASIRERHKDQIEIGSATSLSAEQYAELLQYMQVLREWPTSADFPAENKRPVAADWLLEALLSPL